MWASEEVEEVVLTEGPGLIILQQILQECKVVTNLKLGSDDDGFISYLCHLMTDLKCLYSCLTSLSLCFVVSTSGHNPYMTSLHNPHTCVVLKLKGLAAMSLA